MFNDEFYKVDEKGTTYIVATFFNPVTGEEESGCVKDLDNPQNDIEELYSISINEEVRKIWLHKKGTILIGDTIKVIKGRKVPIGTIAKVVDIFKYYDKYGRWLTTYAVLDNGAKIDIFNCILYNSNEMQSI